MIYYENVKKLVEREMKRREKTGETFDLNELKTNLPHQFRETIRVHPDFPALKTRKVDPSTGTVTWVTKTYKEFGNVVDELAAALLDEGIQFGEMVTIQSHTREEWAIIDEAVIGINAVLVCNYPSLAPGVVEYQLNDSGTTIAFVELKDHIETLIALKDKVPTLRLGIAIVDPRKEDPGFELPDWFTTLDALIEKGKKIIAERPAVRDEIHAFETRIDPDSIGTIVYTSGTTGMPKGAMLSHWNIASNCLASRWFLYLDLTGMTNLSFLPMAHIFERMAGHFYPIMVAMCTAFASDIDNLSRDLQEIKPQYLTGVPRVFEKIYAFVMQTITEYSPFKRKAFNWAVEVGKKYDTLFREQSRITGLKKQEKVPRTPIGLLIKLKIARALVFNKILEKTGGKLLCFLSGGASLPIELARFYGAIGVTILEGYGLTETAPVTNVETPVDVNYGMVGPPLTGTEEKIADDGEILVRGPQVFKGYWNKPEQTSEVIDEDGWFHTGDLGQFDENENLHIVGRKKEIFVLSTGKKVPPITVEELVATSRFMQQLVLQGDGRKFISAIVTPNFDMLKSHVTREMPELAGAMPDFATASHDEITIFLEIPEIRALFQQDIETINEKVDPFDQVKKFVILPFELSEATGDITPSLKFKRAKVYEHYHDLIETMYDKDQSVELSKGHDVKINENNKE